MQDCEVHLSFHWQIGSLLQSAGEVWVPQEGLGVKQLPRTVSHWQGDAHVAEVLYWSHESTMSLHSFAILH